MKNDFQNENNHHNIILGIGSNVGNRLEYIKNAISLIDDNKILKKIKISNIYQSKAVLPNDAPTSWNKDFFNLAISGTTILSPLNLLKNIKNIEKEIGRINRGFWSPREIDIDILTYDNIEFTSKELIIPHKYFLERAFTILPAHELKPEWKYPKKGLCYNKTLKEIISLNKPDPTQCWVTNHKIT